MSFYGYVHWRLTTEISVMYGSEEVLTTTQFDARSKALNKTREKGKLCLLTLRSLSYLI